MMSTYALKPTEEFLNASSELGINFESEDIEKLGRYLYLLLEKNKSFNLTAIKEPSEAWMRHILDSLSLLPYIHQTNAKKIIDVGSGGGVPGIPLAITCPESDFVLLDSTGKKADFLKSVADDLKLNNVSVVNDRAEIAGRQTEHREKYDLVIARALGRLPVLLELTIPLAVIGGNILAIKGEQAQAEIEESKSALHRLHSSVVDMSKTPTGTIIVIKKQRKTPAIYPRKVGEPKHNPLT